MPGRPHATPTSRAALAAFGIAAALTALVACGGDGGASDAERFCGEAIANRDAIVAPSLATEAELEATLEFYRLMGELAPVGIAEEWNVLVETFETASTVVPGDPESEQRMAMAAYASEPAAYAVKVWLDRNCGLDIPITTIAPHAQVPAVTVTTVPTSGAAPVTTAAGEPSS